MGRILSGVSERKGRGAFVAGKGRIGVPGRRNDGQTGGASPDFELKSLFLDRKLGELRALHEVDDLFDLF